MITHTENGKTYRLPGGLSEFQTGLYVHLIDWKWQHLTEEPGIHHHRGLALEYDAILPIALKADWQPVYRPIVDLVRAHHKRFPFRQHKFVGHMASSQAACLNLFVPLMQDPAIAAEVLRNVRPDLDSIATDKLDRGFRIEFWADDGSGKGLLGDHSNAAGTDADVAIAYRDASGRLKLWLIEHKLSEPDFTACGGAVSEGRGADHICQPSSSVYDDPERCYYQSGCGYKYWAITRAHPEVFPAEALRGEGPCPFKRGMNQLWRNTLQALAIENEGEYEKVHFSVTHHPKNTAPNLHRAMEAFQVLLGDKDRFSVFTPDQLLTSPALARSSDLTTWAKWYQNLYWYR